MSISSFHSCRLQFNRHFCKLRKSRDTRSAASVAADIEGDPLRMALAKELSPPMMWLVAAARNSWKSTAFLIRLSRSLRDVSTTAIKHAAGTKLLYVQASCLLLSKIVRFVNQPNFTLSKLQLNFIARCLKITEKVLFNIVSEANYVYILSGQKFIENAKNCETVKYYYQKDQF